MSKLRAHAVTPPTFCRPSLETLLPQSMKGVRIWLVRRSLRKTTRKLVGALERRRTSHLPIARFSQGHANRNPCDSKTSVVHNLNARMILVQGHGERQSCQVRRSFTSGYPRRSRGARV